MNKYRFTLAYSAVITILTVIVFLLSCTSAAIPAPPSPPITPPAVIVVEPPAQQAAFTIVALPDTQKYSKSYPATFMAQTRWIKDNTAAKNIVFTVLLGDITDSQHKKTEPVKQEWANAKNAMNLLEGLRYAALPGNHDNLIGGRIDNTFFNAAFPYTDFENYSWYGGHYPQNGNQNSYSLVDVSGQNLLIMSIGYFGNTTEPMDEMMQLFNWANAVIAKYPDRNVIVATHSVLNSKGGFTNGGQMLWDYVIKRHANIFLVLAGHDCPESTVTKAGEAGNIVNILMCDYQCDEKGGNGYLRLMEFIPSQEIIHVETFSPLTGKLRAGSPRFNIPYSFK